MDRKWMKQFQKFFNEEPSGGGAPAAAVPPDSAGPAVVEGEPPSAPAPAPVADTPPVAAEQPKEGIPDQVLEGLWGPKPAPAQGGPPQGYPPQGYPPQGGPPGPPRDPYAIADPGAPTNEEWEENFTAAQDKYAQHIQAKDPRFAMMARDLAELRRSGGDDRNGRVLNSVQVATSNLERRAFDPRTGVLANNPHYKTNPKVKEVADHLLAEQMRRAVSFAQESGRTVPLDRATSKKAIEQTLLLAMHEAGVSNVTPPSPTAAVIGGELAYSSGPDTGGGQKPLSADEREAYDTYYKPIGVTEADFRKETGI